MPKLWTETIETHRHEVREAILDSAGALLETGGLRSPTMLQIAAEAGIGRATLYKYFPDVEAVLVAWHEREVERHLQQLAALRDLEAVLEAYAFIQHEHGGDELTSVLHRGKHVLRARRRLRSLVRDLIAEDSAVRTDVSPDELADYCLHALGAASTLPSKSAVRRLVAVVLAGLRP